MKNHYQLNITLTLVGPILTRGGHMAAPGVDAAVARDGFERPMLPYSLVKGKVRDALVDLDWDAGRIAEWFGVGSDEANKSFDPERGRLRFGDFVTAGQLGGDSLIERIEIDPATGTASGKMLAMLESPFGYGEDVAFEGRVEFIADDTEAPRIAAAIEQALKWIPSYGALRTVGFGRTKGVATTLVTAGPTSRGSPVMDDVLPVRWDLDRPFCSLGKRHSRNHFESLEVISGAVLKGAAARLILELNGASDNVIDPAQPLGMYPKLCEHFPVIRFGEARPMGAAAAHRPVEPPLSTVVVQHARGQLYDVALEASPRLIGGEAPGVRIGLEGPGCRAPRIRVAQGPARTPHPHGHQRRNGPRRRRAIVLLRIGATQRGPQMRAAGVARVGMRDRHRSGAAG